MKMSRILLTIGVGTMGLFGGLLIGQTVNASAAAKPYSTVIRKTSHNYGIYQQHGYNASDAKGVNPIVHNTRNYQKRTVTVNQVQAVNGRQYAQIKTSTKMLGWVNVNAMDKNTYKLSTPMVKQRPELPTGCEITATTMMLNYAGDHSTKMQLAKEMPRSKNPNKGFVGSPYSPSGWYVYPGGLTKLVKRHLGSSKNLTGASLNTIKSYIRRQHLVVVWVAHVDGFSNHAITITGFNSSRVYYNDPWTGKKTSMTNGSFQSHRRADAYRTLSY